jgi:hypothetical protein
MENEQEKRMAWLGPAVFWCNSCPNDETHSKTCRCDCHPKKEPARPLSYHDIHITTEKIFRTSIFNLPFNLMVTCTRVGGWELWDTSGGISTAVLLAGEYDDSWLVLDVAGHVILDSRKKEGGNG